MARLKRTRAQKEKDTEAQKQTAQEEAHRQSLQAASRKRGHEISDSSDSGDEDEPKKNLKDDMADAAADDRDLFGDNSDEDGQDDGQAIPKSAAQAKRPSLSSASPKALNSQSSQDPPILAAVGGRRRSSSPKSTSSKSSSKSKTSKPKKKKRKRGSPVSESPTTTKGSENSSDSGMNPTD